MKPGKYDIECRNILKATNAEVVVLLVLGGGKGHGVSLGVDSTRVDVPQTAQTLPGFLRGLADSIEGDPDGFAESLAEGPEISPEAKRTNCPHCGGLVIFDDAKHTVYHEAPTCKPWEKKMREHGGQYSVTMAEAAYVQGLAPSDKSKLS